MSAEIFSPSDQAALGTLLLTHQKKYFGNSKIPVLVENPIKVEKLLRGLDIEVATSDTPIPFYYFDPAEEESYMNNVWDLQKRLRFLDPHLYQSRKLPENRFSRHLVRLASASKSETVNSSAYFRALGHAIMAEYSLDDSVYPIDFLRTLLYSELIDLEKIPKNLTAIQKALLQEIGVKAYVFTKSNDPGEISHDLEKASRYLSKFQLRLGVPLLDFIFKRDPEKKAILDFPIRTIPHKFIALMQMINPQELLQRYPELRNKLPADISQSPFLSKILDEDEKITEEEMSIVRDIVTNDNLDAILKYGKEYDKLNKFFEENDKLKSIVLMMKEAFEAASSFLIIFSTFTNEDSKKTIESTINPILIEIISKPLPLYEIKNRLSVVRDFFQKNHEDKSMEDTKTLVLDDLDRLIEKINNFTETNSNINQNEIRLVLYHTKELINILGYKDFLTKVMKKANPIYSALIELSFFHPDRKEIIELLKSGVISLETPFKQDYSYWAWLFMKGIFKPMEGFNYAELLKLSAGEIETAKREFINLLKSGKNIHASMFNKTLPLITDIFFNRNFLLGFDNDASSSDELNLLSKKYSYLNDDGSSTQHHLGILYTLSKYYLSLLDKDSSGGNYSMLPLSITLHRDRYSSDGKVSSTGARSIHKYLVESLQEFYQKFPIEVGIKAEDPRSRMLNYDIEIERPEQAAFKSDIDNMLDHNGMAICIGNSSALLSSDSGYDPDHNNVIFHIVGKNPKTGKYLIIDHLSGMVKYKWSGSNYYTRELSIEDIYRSIYYYKGQWIELSYSNQRNDFGLFPFDSFGGKMKNKIKGNFRKANRISYAPKKADHIGKLVIFDFKKQLPLASVSIHKEKNEYFLEIKVKHKNADALNKLLPKIIRHIKSFDSMVGINIVFDKKASHDDIVSMSNFLPNFGFKCIEDNYYRLFIPEVGEISPKSFNFQSIIGKINVHNKYYKEIVSLINIITAGSEDRNKILELFVLLGKVFADQENLPSQNEWQAIRENGYKILMHKDFKDIQDSPDLDKSNLPNGWDSNMALGILKKALTEAHAFKLQNKTIFDQSKNRLPSEKKALINTLLSDFPNNETEYEFLMAVPSPSDNMKLWTKFLGIPESYINSTVLSWTKFNELGIMFESAINRGVRPNPGNSYFAYAGTEVAVEGRVSEQDILDKLIKTYKHERLGHGYLDWMLNKLLNGNTALNPVYEGVAGAFGDDGREYKGKTVSLENFLKNPMYDESLNGYSEDSIRKHSHLLYVAGTRFFRAIIDLLKSKEDNDLMALSSAGYILLDEAIGIYIQNMSENSKTSEFDRTKMFLEKLVRRLESEFGITKQELEEKYNNYGEIDNEFYENQ